MDEHLEEAERLLDVVAEFAEIVKTGGDLKAVNAMTGAMSLLAVTAQAHATVALVHAVQALQPTQQAASSPAAIEEPTTTAGSDLPGDDEEVWLSGRGRIGYAEARELAVQAGMELVVSSTKAGDPERRMAYLQPRQPPLDGSQPPQAQ